MPRLSRYATNRSYSVSGLRRSATVVKGMPRALVTQTPARSQFARCGSASMTPLPDASPSFR